MTPSTTLLLEQLEDVAPGILLVIGGPDGEYGPSFPLALRRLRHERGYNTGPAFVHAQIRMEGSLVRATAIGQGNELALDGHALDCRVESVFARLSQLLAQAHGLEGVGWRLVATGQTRNNGVDPERVTAYRPVWALCAPHEPEPAVLYWADTGAPAVRNGEPIPGLALVPAGTIDDAPTELLPAALAALVLHSAPAIVAFGGEP